MSETTAARRLMDLTIGYWASQAVYVSAKLGIADRLAEQQLDAGQLARRVGADEPSLIRLLRFLTELDLVGIDDTGCYRNTELGELLRTTEHGSMRDLALLYGEEFYAGWGKLLHTVRTGERGFDTVHGAPMYQYFGQSLELSAKFDRAMAAGSTYFHELSLVHDFSDTRVLVDIGGGNGALLDEVLRANPDMRGVLFDVLVVIESAKIALAGSPVADRVDFVAGDYREDIPAGHDAYMLSRILHGRDDEKCVDLLSRVRSAIADEGTLLVIERVLPEAGERSLAVWFDMHMLTIAAGEERSQSHYAELLSKSGFELTDSHELPLELRLLVARAV
jgi:hypothetical protein